MTFKILGGGESEVVQTHIKKKFGKKGGREKGLKIQLISELHL